MLKRRIAFILLFNAFIALVLIPAGIFYGPFPHLRKTVVGSIATSRHPQVAEWFLSPEKIKSIVGETKYAEETQNIAGMNFDIINSEEVIIEDIKDKRFSGKVMLISNPLRLRVATTSRLGDTGETVMEITNRVKATAGVNGGSFSDPNGTGNGGFADGITVHNGKYITELEGDAYAGIIGIDKKGVLIVGSYNKQQMINMGIQEAVTFSPALVINGRGQIKSGDGGWGIAPRTAIGQRADGTIILVVINGRQMGSVGATLREVQDLMLEYDAITAANLDGGASATMVYNGGVINNPSSLFGERRIPTAWVVMPNQSANFE